ncbi:MAG: peptidoglycan-associated lipoprotein Pal [Thermoanaerobaculia bacterium]
MKSSRWMLLSVLTVVAVATVGCPKKAPKSSSVAPAVTAEPVAIPAPKDLSANDPKASPLDADLLAANEYAYRNGLLGDVYFEFDRAELRDEARERLAKNAEFLRQRPEFTVTIEGHCDERGTAEYNLALGQSRANMARNYIGSLGVTADRLTGLSLGEERPACTETQEGCWSQNRRAHFVLTGRAGAR